MPELAQFTAEFFKALAHPMRVRILDSPQCQTKQSFVYSTTLGRSSTINWSTSGTSFLNLAQRGKSERRIRDWGRAMSSRLEFTAALCRFSGRADGQMIQ